MVVAGHPIQMVMPFGAKLLNFVFKTRNVVAKSHKTRNCVSKTRNFGLKMMNFAGLQAKRPPQQMPGMKGGLY